MGSGARRGALLELDLLVGRVSGRTQYPGGFGRRERGVVPGHSVIGVTANG